MVLMTNELRDVVPLRLMDAMSPVSPFVRTTWPAPGPESMTVTRSPLASVKIALSRPPMAKPDVWHFTSPPQFPAIRVTVRSPPLTGGSLAGLDISTQWAGTCKT